MSSLQADISPNGGRPDTFMHDKQNETSLLGDMPMLEKERSDVPMVDRSMSDTLMLERGFSEAAMDR